jgi:DNA-binding NtrC family response regulator
MHGPFHVVAGRDLSDESAAAVLLGETEQPGALAGAAGGFLFINGLEELSRTAENILLGVLQSGRLPASAGGAQLKLRVLSAAPPGFELESRMNQDLLSLLSTVVIRVPPLREYAEDVPELLRLHAEQLVDEENLPFRRFSVAAQNRLRNYPWPGNVRELQNVVKRLLLLSQSEEIDLGEVESQLAADAPATEPLIKQDLLAMPLREAREHIERANLQQQLLLCGGKVGQLAKRVGMERTHLYRKLRALGVDFRQAATDD